jgi:hypothetical protein
VHHLHAERRLLVSSSCVGLIDAWRHDEHGKRSGTDSPADLRSGYSDAAKLGLWPIFHDDILGAFEVAA